MTDRLPRSPARQRVLRAITLLAALALAGCTTVLARNAVPEALLAESKPYGIDVPLLRYSGDRLDQRDLADVFAGRKALFQRIHAPQIARGETIELVSLALSGGGPDGAFGAGLLAGWTERGDRPQFQLVTGVSTGAIIALFAFLGPEHDAKLREIYTTYETRDLVVPAIFAGLTGGTALLDASGYRRLIEQYITPEIVERIAAEYEKGRVLLIGTTNIDSSQPVTWNIGAIAASGHPMARTLIHDVIQASSAIPAAFPPAIIPVEAGGRVYDEMHVDGGATQQVILYSPGLPVGVLDAAAGARVKRTIYVIVNNKLRKAYEPARPRVFSIAAKAGSSLISGSGTGDLYKIFAIAERDGMELNVRAIPTDFTMASESAFDPRYMSALYRLGYEMGRVGEVWQPYPPGWVPREELEARIAATAD